MCSLHNMELWYKCNGGRPELLFRLPICIWSKGMLANQFICWCNLISWCIKWCTFLCRYQCLIHSIFTFHFDRVRFPRWDLYIETGISIGGKCMNVAKSLLWRFIIFFNFLSSIFQDFILTAILAVFWLAGAAAWSNGASGLKTVTDAVKIQSQCGGRVLVLISSFSRLNISLLFGYLNFFLWASDLWFLYKETHWFKERQQPNGEGGVGVGTTTMNAPSI